MNHWLDRVLLLLQAETSDLRELARLAGGNPKTFYRGANLDGVDISGQDVREMQFTNFSISSTTADATTKIDATYTPRFDLFEDDWSQYSELDVGDVATLSSPDDFKRRGHFFSRNEQHALAAALYLVATRKFPQDFRLWLELGWSLYQNSDYAKATRILYDTVQKFPNIDRARIQLATVLQKSGNLSEAINILQEATQVFPARTQVWVKLIDLLSTYDIDRAISSQNDLLQLQPDKLNNWLRLASLKVRGGDSEGAFDLYQTAIEKFEYASDLVRALINVSKAKVISAPQTRRREIRLIGVLEALIQRFPEQVEIYRWMADAHARIGNLSEARRSIERATAQFPTQAAPWKWLGDDLRHTGDLSATHAAYRQAVALRSDDPGPWKWVGHALEEQGELSEAIATYVEAIEATRDAAPRKWLSEAYERTGRQDEAISVLHEARKYHPEDRAVWKWLAEALFRAKHPAAEEVRREAMEMFPSLKIRRNARLVPALSTSKP